MVVLKCACKDMISGIVLGPYSTIGLICRGSVELITSSSNYDQFDLDVISSIENSVFIDVTNARPRFLQSFELIGRSLSPIGRFRWFRRVANVCACYISPPSGDDPIP